MGNHVNDKKDKSLTHRSTKGRLHIKQVSLIVGPQANGGR